MVAFKTGPQWYMPDLRKSHDAIATLENGKLYRKANILQVWWHHDAMGNPFDKPEDGRETWTLPSIHDARESFADNEKWND